MIEELNNASQSLAWLPYAIALIPVIIAIVPSFFSFLLNLIMMLVGYALMFATSYYIFGSAEQFLFYLSDSDRESLMWVYVVFLTFSAYLGLKKVRIEKC